MHPTTGQAAALPAGAHFETGRAENLRPRRRGRRFVALVAAALSAAALMAPASHAAVVEQPAETAGEQTGESAARGPHCYIYHRDQNGRVWEIEVPCPQHVRVDVESPPQS